MKNLKTHHCNAPLENLWKAHVISTFSHKQHLCLNLENMNKLSLRWGLESCSLINLLPISAGIISFTWESTLRKNKQSAVTSSKTQEKEGSGFSYCDSWMEVLQPLRWSCKENGRKKYRRKWDWWWGCWLWQWVRAWLNESLIMFDSPPLKSHGLQRTQIRIAQEKLERS